MNISTIPIITVSYNAPALIDRLLSSIRKYYDNQIYIIDGSNQSQYKLIEDIVNNYSNIKLIHFDYNIHHGPGMSWAFTKLNLEGQVLVIDSDVIVEQDGFIESLTSHLKPEMYGVGHLTQVDKDGFSVNEHTTKIIKYLHPALMLCNLNIVRQWPLPIKHGAPLIETMEAISDARLSDKLLFDIPWVGDDFSPTSQDEKHFVRHDWQGTVIHTGGYHLDDNINNENQKEKNNVPSEYNHDLLSLIPVDARGVLEVGCGNGALANAYKSINNNCQYIGIDINGNHAEQASRSCDFFYNTDIEIAEEIFFRQFSQMINVWVFGDVLEHLKEPSRILDFARKTLPKDGSIIASIPNIQHWSILAKLTVGDFRYEDFGLLDRTHLRFFTRATIFELFQNSGFKIEQGFPRIFGEITNPGIVKAIRLMAESVGADPDIAIKDATPLQYVIKAIPI